MQKSGIGSGIADRKLYLHKFLMWKRILQYEYLV